jgi:hypothetical protein
MITEIVTFESPEGMRRERVVALFEESAEIWRAHPKLHRKVIPLRLAAFMSGIFSPAESKRLRLKKSRSAEAQTWASSARRQAACPAPSCAASTAWRPGPAGHCAATAERQRVLL